MYTERPPEPALADRIACLWHQVCEADGTHLVVPDGCVDLIWGPGGPHVAGPDTGPMPAPMRAGDAYVGIRFKPGATGLVFGVPLSELRDQRVPAAALDALTAPLLTDPTASLLGVPRLAGLDAVGAARMLALKAVVLARLRDTPAPDPAAPAIAAALRAGRTVAEVAWDLGYSERQLHRRTLAGFGYAPKTLQRVVRFQRALRLARSGVPLAEVAASSGYTDQAHLSHDVKRLSGVSMTHLAA
ncbi:DUF6597 domain-containing transcriptional factor [Nonomuraea sp. NPDC050536]|uniref:DUF6597 domain-containing transcriptional factor n=1 Tax=Nonomuraea sp. NPDC050536 TaxID=3364366 RepID=UPI0037C6A495